MWSESGDREESGIDGGADLVPFHGPVNLA